MCSIYVMWNVRQTYIYRHMPILLKEITLNYEPDRGYPRIEQLIRDYYAMFTLWKSAGSGKLAFGGGPEPEKRTAVIDQVFEQVAKMLGSELLIKFGTDKKETRKLEHYLKMEDWLNLHAEIETLVKQILPGWRFQGVKGKLERDPRNTNMKFSSLVKRLIGTSRQFPSTEEPKETPPTPVSVEPPTSAPSVSLPPPLEPTPRAYPPLPADPSFAKPIGVGDEPKRIPGWEGLMTRYGYTWSEEDKAYKSSERNVLIRVFPNNSAQVFLPNGGIRDFPTLGALFNAMEQNKKKRHHKKGEPAAHLTKEDFTKLFEFLYTG